MLIGSDRGRYAVGVALAVWLCLLLSSTTASAVPSYSRKYATSCQTCHTVFPALTNFGEAFRRNGYRFPSSDGSLDSDAAKAPMLALGQEEYERTFPNSVWPAQINEVVPLSAMVDGTVSYRIPGSNAEAQSGNTFTWNGILNTFRVYLAGSFSDRLTYFTKLVATGQGALDVQAGYLLWNDLFGPPHAVNVWVGRLMSPQLTSYGSRNGYLAETVLPSVSIGGLLNPSNPFTLGRGHTDGVEVNGILAHRIGYSAGWLASTAQAGLRPPTAEDAYARIGFKLGGMSLDGEGPSGMAVADATKPWSETSLTVDVYGYHGVTISDNGTALSGLTAQRSGFNIFGAAARFNWRSLQLDTGAQVQRHFWPYQGSLPIPPQPEVPNGLPGTPDPTRATGYLAYGELAYTVFPWLVPGLRAEYTRVESDYGMGNILRVLPGAAILIRPNVKVVISGGLERVYKLPPAAQGTPTSWGAANAWSAPSPGSRVNFEAEFVNAYLAWAL